MVPQLLLKLILPKVVDHIGKLFKLRKVLDYVELDNNLDVQVRDIEQKCTNIGFRVNAMQTVLKDLDNDSHPPKDYDDRIKKLEEKVLKKKNG